VREKGGGRAEGDDMSITPHPLSEYVREIQTALDARLDYPALALALALPDICASLQADDCKTDKDLYAEWCRRWVITSKKPASGDPGLFMTGKQLWDLRCRFLHNGREDLGKPISVPSVELRTFELLRRELSPGGGMVRVRDWETGTIKSSAESICKDIIRGVITWANAFADNATVARNWGTLLDLDRSVSS
jgi:hypothetical protein